MLMANHQKKTTKEKLRKLGREERRKLREQGKERKKNQIFTAAMKLFTEKGVENVSVEDITLKAKVSYGTFYSFFSKKDDVLMYYFQQEYEKSRDEVVRSINSKETLAEKIEALLDSYWKHVIRNREFTRAMARERIMRWGKLNTPNAHMFQESLANLIEQDGQQRGVGIDANEAMRISQMIIGINLMYVICWINGTIKTKQECLERLMIDTNTILAGIFNQITGC